MQADTKMGTDTVKTADKLQNDLVAFQNPTMS